MATNKRSKKNQPHQFPDEHWGDKLHRAYRLARRDQNLTYRQAADRISQILPVSDAYLIRMEDRPTPPTNPRTRLLAYFAIMTYGFDPADLEIPPETVPQLEAFDTKRVADLLKPSSPCTIDNAA